MDWSGCDVVESVPGKLSGTPVLRNTRMPADGVVENFDDGISAEEIADDFMLDLEDVRAVLRFARRDLAKAS